MPPASRHAKPMTATGVALGFCTPGLAGRFTFYSPSLQRTAVEMSVEVRSGPPRGVRPALRIPPHRSRLRVSQVMSSVVGEGAPAKNIAHSPIKSCDTDLLG